MTTREADRDQKRPRPRHRTGPALLALALLAAPLAARAQSSAPSASAPPAADSNPHLSVATVQLQDGIRAAKIIGSTVENAQGAQVGTVSDLILNKTNTVVMAVISAGGFAGIGSKLVAVPFTDLQLGNNGKVVLPNATKESISAMPSFVY